MLEKEFEQEAAQTVEDALIEEEKEESLELEESEKSLSEENEENQDPLAEAKESDFLKQWKERHQAFLKQKGAEESPESDSKKQEVDVSLKQSKNSSSFRQKTEKKSDVLPRVPLPKSVVLRALPVLIVSALVVIGSLYFVTPLGSLKEVVVKGNDHVPTKTIIKNSLITPQDYFLTTIVDKKGYEKNIAKSSPWIQSANIAHSFPNRLTVTIKEFKQIGFVKQGEQFYSVLSNGQVSDTPTPIESLPTKFTSIQLSDRELISQLVAQLATVKPEVLAAIKEITLTPSKATNDLLSIEMHSGHLVLVPLSEIDLKLPYYPNIAQQLMAISVIDMEVGIFSYIRTQ